MSKLVLVRHGRSAFNDQNRFTGWMDVPLIEAGIEEAKKAGKLLKDKKFHPVIAFTSKLQRAQNTLKLILTELDQNGLKTLESEALNERHYGDLQGKNKEETAKIFGDEQVHIWRRSYDVPPPGGESLKDTAERTLPYFKSEILKHLQSGEDVLVVAHGNSLRSIVMEIEKLTPAEILKREIPTGTPLFYECAKDGSIKPVSA
ncbi:MAG TPA: 2,3-diphosphoglycerate-dependent phosphoglycerate mutase [Bdellovibrionota bacterium]|jgi:2,3-bisphosphoglycerate-dependent phosphoglycerate mutase|nr:2,3-diphosphoglycerate-dependent phosphoglycerate mutase [Bdellovibrionota bacterium]